MARKIETEMISAIRAGKSAKLSNTVVEVNGQSTFVRLHGNLIAIIGHPLEGTCWTLAGWNTTTTRSRIRALANAFNWAAPANVRGVAHVRGKPISSTEWVNALQ